MTHYLRLLAFAAVLTGLTFCSRNPYAGTNKSYKAQAKTLSKQVRATPQNQTVSMTNAWVGTTNFNLRKPNFVVIHHTAQNSCDQTLKTFTRPSTSVSAHYVICKDGTVHHMLNDYLRAWHGGIGRWGNINDLNSVSIGIEIDNNGFEAFTEPQLANLLVVLDSLKSRYNIPAANFIGHADIAPTRKVDPNVLFPWKRLSEQGYGIWWNDTAGISVPAQFEPLLALRIIGFDTRDTSAVINTFNRKYLQQDKARTLDEAGRKVLYTLYRQFL